MVPVGMNVNFGNMFKLDQWVIQNGKMDVSIFFYLLVGQNLTCTFSCDANSIF